MGYIDSGKAAGATVHHGGEQHGNEGFFIKPTIFTDVHPDMKIVKEEIFGPVAVITKFKDEAEVVEMANNTTYGLGAHLFTQNVERAIRMAHAVEAGSTWVCRFQLCILIPKLSKPLCKVNCAQDVATNVPFGGYKQSGIGRELGEYALETSVDIFFFLVL